MRISGATYEFEEAHTLTVKLVDPEREEQEVLSLTFGPMEEPPPLLHPGSDPAMLVPAVIGWQAGHFGLYTVEVFIGDHRERSIPILVRDARELNEATPAAPDVG